MIAVGLSWLQALMKQSQQAPPATTTRGSYYGNAGTGREAAAKGMPWLPGRGGDRTPVGSSAYMRDILGKVFVPGAQKYAEKGERLWRDALKAYNTVDERASDYASTVTEGWLKQQTKPGGAISEALNLVDRSSISSGFGVNQTGGQTAGTARVQGQLTDAYAAEGVKNLGAFRQQFGQEALQQLGLAGSWQQGVQDNLVSIFTGAATAEQPLFNMWAINRQL